jgi:hypothetical protein
LLGTEGTEMSMLRKAMASWKPYASLFVALATLVLTAGGRWKPH